MDDSDQDFVDLCTKLLKRNRKKPVAQRQPKKSTDQHISQTTAGERKTRKKNKRDDNTGSQCTAAVSGAQSDVTGGSSGDAGPTVSTECGMSAKEKVLHRMQQFKRASPQRMVFSDNNQPTDQEDHSKPESHRTEIQPEPLDRDEALAHCLQQELDREARLVDLEDEGLFFCQLCNKDLSHMTSDGRTQHINRCLDEKEVHAAPPQLPGVPECPICGKRFKSLKSRSTHLKRCSSDMGVPPAVLLQALQKQAEETHSIPSTSQITKTGGNKRKGSSKSNLPASKKSKKKPEALDEDTMVAMALSTSLLEQEREKQRETETEREIIIETIASNTSRSPTLKWRPLTGKGRGKKRKGVMSRSPPLLLIQDAEAALARLEERVSALLLRSRAPSPPTPTRCPSSLRGWNGAAPLWQKSALLADKVCCVADFYTPELREFIVPWESTKTIVPSSLGTDKLNSTVHPLRAGTPVTISRESIPPSSSHTPCSSPAVSSPGAGQHLVGSQALRDLMELAEEGMTLTQYGYATTDLVIDKQSSAGQATNLHLSGFVPEEAEELNDRGRSGFLPEIHDVHMEDTHKHQSGRPIHQREEEERKHQSVSLSRLASDLGSMVNNPQLSDVQLQVDSGEVYFAHSFMVYARCPLLAEMIHESGFGVQEEGVPAAQRVLLSDVPGQAVFALLEFLYTAHCSVPYSLQPHVLELASRFDLGDLQEFCQLQEESSLQGDDTDQEQHPNNQTDQVFVELLRSMWNDEDENEGANTYIGLDNSKEDQSDDLRLGDREIHEEQVNEDELVEIYEFAATQKQRNIEEEDSVEEGKQFSDPEMPDTKLTGEEDQQKNYFETDTSLDRSYNRLFSESLGVYEDEALSVLPSDTENKRTPRSQHHRSNHLPLSELSCRTLLQSSASVVDKLSPSPPPNAPNMPVPRLSPGLSPGPVDRCGGDERTAEILKESRIEIVKRKDHGSQAICVTISPHSSPKNKAPELVVLSDSSEDMNVDLTVLSSRSPSPQNMPSFTNIKEQLMPESSDLNKEEKDPLAVLRTDCELSPVDCSPEVSWLIPSTPVQSGKSVRTSSSQTKSSICRTQLFPRGDASTSQSPIKGSMLTDPMVGSVSRSVGSMSSSEKSDRGTSFDLTKDKKLDSSGFAVPQSPANYSQASNSTHPRSRLNSSKQDTPLHVPTYSSTPVHTEHLQPPTHPAASPLNTERVVSTSCPSPEVQSFHLSPLSECSYNKSKLSEESSKDKNNIENEQASWERNEPRENISEADGGECSFQQSFMDEPPMAFNDSWGLDACAENPGCFSLKLEDSGGSVQRDCSPETRKKTTMSITSTTPSPVAHREQCGAVTNTCTSPNRQTPSETRANLISLLTPSPPVATSHTLPQSKNSPLDSKIWDSWDEEDEETDVAPPLSERLKPSVHKTPISNFKKRQALVPITPMPHYSDMDTPELKNKLNKFGVRPLPKRQMILKLKEIHQYTHQLVSSDSEDEAPSTSRTTQSKPPSGSCALNSRPISCTQTARFKQPTARAATSPMKLTRDTEPEALSASQGSNTSSTAASEESERSNPEIVQLSDGDSDSDGAISASQAATRLQDRLQAVRAFILSDSALYSQILQYQPLVLSQFQQQLKAAGIRLGVSKLVDYLDSQCITFTTAKPGQSAPSRRRVKKTNKGAKANGESGVRRKKAVTATH